MGLYSICLWHEPIANFIVRQFKYGSTALIVLIKQRFGSSTLEKQIDGFVVAPFPTHLNLTYLFIYNYIATENESGYYVLAKIESVSFNVPCREEVDTTGNKV